MLRMKSERKACRNLVEDGGRLGSRRRRPCPLLVPCAHPTRPSDARTGGPDDEEEGPVMTPASSLGRPGSLRLGMSVALALVIAAALLIFAGAAEPPPASGATSAPAVSQCDAPAYPTGAGYQVTCTITIVNTVTAQGATSSTVTATACLAAAGVLPPSGCTTTVTTSNQLVTSVDQCNGIVYGGGSNVTCVVTVDDTVPTGTATSGVTVNQCNGSGTGGGIAPTVECVPTGSTTNATVTECNGSGNGGGASMRERCTVTGAAMAMPVTITQCNGSANTGGSTVTCSATINDTFVTPPPPTTTTTAPPTTTT